MVEKLMLERKKLKITQQEMANVIGVSCSGYRYKEVYDKVQFTREEMIKIYEHLVKKGSDITFNQLWYK